jgi:hypothetical protein
MPGILTSGLVGFLCLVAAWAMDAAHRLRHGAALVLLLFCTGCAGTITYAVGEHARAAIAQPQACPPTAAPAVLGTRTVKVEKFDDKVGFKPQLESTETTTEPALAPVPEQAPLHESQGAKVSETGGGIIKTVLGIGRAAVVGLFRWLLVP